MARTRKPKVSYVLCVTDDLEYGYTDYIPIGTFSTREKLDEFLGELQYKVYGNVEASTPDQYFEAAAAGHFVTPRLIVSVKDGLVRNSNLVEPWTGTAKFKNSDDNPDTYFITEEKYGLYVRDAVVAYVKVVPLDDADKTFLS